MSLSELTKTLESLHPLENKLLLSFQGDRSLSAQELLAAAGLDESRLDMASGWLQSKGLLDVQEESVTSSVSLTETGREYLEKGTPEMRIINALREGKQFTVKDVIQNWGMDPSEISSAVGALRESKVVQIVQGGILVLSGGADLSPYEFLADLIKTVSTREQGELSSFVEREQVSIQTNFHKRGKSKGIFRINEKKNRSYRLTASGQGAPFVAQAARRGHRRSLGAHA